MKNIFAEIGWALLVVLAIYLLFFFGSEGPKFFYQAF